MKLHHKIFITIGFFAFLLVCFAAILQTFGMRHAADMFGYAGVGILATQGMLVMCYIMYDIWFGQAK